MPLVQSASKSAISENISREMHAGKPQRQAIAIAMDVARRSRQQGGAMPWYVKQEARNLTHQGPIPSIVGGRTDHHSMNVGAGSYVLPADHVSHLGQGNTGNGFAVLNRMFGGGGPYGVGKSLPVRHGSGAPKPPPAPHIRPPHFARGGSPRDQGGARGHGGIGHPVPVNTAGGEYNVPPEWLQGIIRAIAEHYGPQYATLDNAHKILDQWVLNERNDHIKTLRKLPPPAKD